VDSFPNGEPPMLETGESAILTLQFVLALREAADLEAAFGSASQAEAYRALADKTATAVAASCWDAKKGLLADTPARASWSQHVNLLGVLANALPVGTSHHDLMTRVLDDTSLTQTTYYFRFYLFRAMMKSALGDRYLEQLAPWRRMLDLGLTTWAETPDPTRSDSHAWSAHPTADLLTIVAGIEPAAPGFTRVRIRPHIGSLTSLSASLPTPRGDVAVSYRRTAAGLETEVTLPKGVTGSIALTGSPIPLKEGKNSLTLR